MKAAKRLDPITDYLRRIPVVRQVTVGGKLAGWRAVLGTRSAFGNHPDQAVKALRGPRCDLARRRE